MNPVLPCLIAAIVGDRACTIISHHWNIHHAHYEISLADTSFRRGLVGKIAVAAVAFGLASVVFAEMTHGLSKVFKRLSPWPIVRPVIGGCIVIGLAHLIGVRLPGPRRVGGPAPPAAGLDPVELSPRRRDGVELVWKICFTAVTLGAGSRGAR